MYFWSILKILLKHPKINIKDSNNEEINTNVDLVYLSGCSQIITSEESGANNGNTALQCHHNKNMMIVIHKIIVYGTLYANSHIEMKNIQTRYLHLKSVFLMGEYLDQIYFIMQKIV